MNVDTYHTGIYNIKVQYTGLLDHCSNHTHISSMSNGNENKCSNIDCNSCIGEHTEINGLNKKNCCDFVPITMSMKSEC